MLLKDQRAIITGGGRGIGRAIARRFAREGAQVLVAARTSAEVNAVAEEIRAAGGQAARVAADVSRQDGCERAYRAAVEEFGGVDVLVNNAGVLGPIRALHEISAEEWDTVLAVNLRSAFLLSKLVLPAMLERKRGAILNISSVSGKGAFGFNGPYAASKAGMLALTRTIAAETGRKGVRVNAICPGPVPETRMSQELGARLAERFGKKPEEVLEGAVRGILQGRAQTVEEIAAAAVFLCSEQASAITGQALNVDGGMVFG
jgi:NAD(P)-dependent dehydrogenase (short-subunit alcohol dehydrogenase family)